jgi:uncharacterized membrane protein YtjA (UPF0391 family)
MLYYALVFFIIAIIAAVLGFGGIAAGAASIAKVLFFIFVIIFLVTLVMGVVRRWRDQLKTMGPSTFTMLNRAHYGTFEDHNRWRRRKEERRYL